MRHDDDGAPFTVELLKDAENFFTAMAVERAGRFVGKNDLRIVDERAGDGNALLLSAGKLARGMMRAFAHPESLQDHAGFLTPFFLFLACIYGGNFDIAHRIQLAQQMIALEDETEMLTPQLRQFIGFKFRCGAAGNQIFAFRRPVQAAENVHQRRFARTGRTDDRHHLAPLDGQVHMVQNRREVVARGVMPGDALEREQRRISHVSYQPGRGPRPDCRSRPCPLRSGPNEFLYSPCR